MVEQKIIETIIRELGPAGLLICGLYLIGGKHAATIDTHLKKINEQLDNLTDALRQLADRKNGKN